MFLLLILIIGTSTGYDFKCPAKAEWKLKANVTCSLEEKYVCLFNVLERKYQDNCLGSDRSSIGSKLVFQPLFNLAECDVKTFQPIVFNTHGNSDCLLLKSRCDEEGQVVYSNGSLSNDTVCRCDYTEGYAFVSKPKNSCFCKPSEEDCSCFRVKCSKLSPDYQCITDEKETSKTKCEELYPHVSYKRQNRTAHHKQSGRKRFTYARQVTYYIIAAIVLYIIMVELKIHVVDQLKYRRSRRKSWGNSEVAEVDPKTSNHSLHLLEYSTNNPTALFTSGTSETTITSDANSFMPAVKYSVATANPSSATSLPQIIASTIEPSFDTINQRCIPGGQKPPSQDTIPCDFIVSNTEQKGDVGPYLPLTLEHDENKDMDELSRGNKILPVTFEKTSEYDSSTNKLIAGNIIGNEESNPLQFKDESLDVSNTEQKGDVWPYLPLTLEHDEIKDTDELSSCNKILPVTFKETSEYDFATNKCMAVNITGHEESNPSQFKDDRLNGGQKPPSKDTIPCDFVVSKTAQKGNVGPYLPLTLEHDGDKDMEELSRCNKILPVTFQKTSEYDSATNKLIASNIIGNEESNSSQFKDERLDDDEKHKFIDEIFRKGECGKHYLAKVVFVGRSGTGKTSLMRRLLWQNKEDVLNLQSTDGIEMNICNMNVTNGEWTTYEKKDDDLSRLIHPLYRERKLNKRKGPGQNERKHNFVQKHTSTHTDSKVQMEKQSENDANRSQNRNNKDIPETDHILAIRYTKPKGHTSMYDKKDNIEHSSDYTIKSNENENESGIDENIDKIASAIIETYLHPEDDAQQEMMAFCCLWDFAGKKDFHATHQIFMSKSAIYILVTNTLDLSTDENTPDDSDNDVKFWFEAIHSHGPNSDNGPLDPPIIVVCTNEDKFQNDSERQKQHENINNSLCRVLSKEMKRHLRNIYFVSNTDDEDTVFKEIRQDISEQAMGMEDWGRDCPLKWLLFQQVLRKLKQSSVPISSTTKLMKIAKHANIDIKDDDEFKRCLQYLHDIGTIIYFDDHQLKDHVILDPKWLVHAFRCLVSDKIRNVAKVSDDWKKLRETGELTDSLVTELFKKEPKLKFEENKTLLLEVMKRFDIVMNMKNINVVYMPCMIEYCSLAKIQKQLMRGSRSHRRTSWLCLEFDFLPPVFFNHVLSWYIEQYNVSTILDKTTCKKRYGLFRHLCVFDIYLDMLGYVKFVVCVAKNIIALQVWNSDQTFGWLRRKLFQFLDSLCKRYRLHITIEKALTCKNGDFLVNRNKLSSLRDKYYRCVEHKEKHLSLDLIESWDLDTELLELIDKGYNGREPNIVIDYSTQSLPIEEIIHQLVLQTRRLKESTVVLQQLRNSIIDYIPEYNSEQITFYVNYKKMLRIYNLPFVDINKTKTKLIFNIKGNILKIRNTDTGDEKEEIFH